ncbi:MAG: acetoin:2,6-dichlorophenolindophenol oxidoreductase subunit beta [Pseudonocardiales bacterium]|jgi:pyruvate/2-oxoglutarate/acetoin dehydrogenase E1 component|nr:acetoin:2,6-dichlorophenolindophenol oxidoreductase subunit beta [Pseudonocardiales bacterium]
MPEITYAQAVNSALDRALLERAETLLYGEDVAKWGGIFGCTKGLAAKHGDRVFDTPISESAILGSAVGAALLGQRPIVEIMWVDFALVALDQLVNQAANVRYVSRGQLTAPITVRTQQGAMPGSCAQHSQNLEAFFAHTPGLVVGLPATAQDAYDMLLSAIWCDDPTIIIENRTLYFDRTETVDLDGRVAPVGGARVARAGADVTVVTWSAMLRTVLGAAESASRDGVDVEVIDLRWLQPLDMSTVLTSVAKTSRLMVVHEANRTGGFGAEIAAQVAEDALDLLDAPVRRIAVPDSRMPAAPHLQRALIPSEAHIAYQLVTLAKF